jgi:hypothetical protein
MKSGHGNLCRNIYIHTWKWYPVSTNETAPSRSIVRNLNFHFLQCIVSSGSETIDPQQLRSARKIRFNQNFCRSSHHGWKHGFLSYRICINWYKIGTYDKHIIQDCCNCNFRPGMSLGAACGFWTVARLVFFRGRE